MRLVIVTGIFPPDIGGPATHAADLADELGRRGHAVTVLTLSGVARPEPRPGLVRYPRGWPWPIRSAAVIWWLVRQRRTYDVAYSTGLGPLAVAGCRLARRPVVVKVVGDPAWERGRRQQLTAAEFSDFQEDRFGGLRLRAMLRVRNWTVRTATAVTTPSEYLREVVVGWAGTDRAAVIPNGVRGLPENSRARSSSRAGFLHVVSVGRLVAHKRVDLLVEAVAGTTGITMDVVGSGPERAALAKRIETLGAGDRVRLIGPLGHEEVLDRLTQADALVSASSYEGLPHVFIEALVCGTPVVTGAVGGSVEAVTDGVDGLIVDPPNVESFTNALVRLRDDPSLRIRLSNEAATNGAGWRFERCADEVEVLLERLCLDGDTTRLAGTLPDRSR